MRFISRRYAILVLAGLAVGVTLFGIAHLRRDERPAVPPSQTAGRGRILYETHCAICHGPTGKGDGAGAKVIRQSMRDFSNPVAMRDVEDRFLFEIIKKGSSQFGRSNAMPSWGMKLSDEEIRAVVAHIRTLASGATDGTGQRRETP
jgi:mono/diheme cytochrome c family protein